MKKKVLSLFSGIGAFEKALKNLGIEFDLVNYCEIDKYASKSYSLIHNVSEEKNLVDVTKVNTDLLPKDLDLVTYGFPCQDISQAGKQRGFEDARTGERTRSGLFFDALRIIEDTKPKFAIAENVKALTSKKFEKEFKIVLDSLEQAGYRNFWKVLNAKDYGIPQNRERVFVISVRNDVYLANNTFIFPNKEPLQLKLKDLLQQEVEEKYYLKESKAYFMKHSFEEELKGNGFRFSPHIKDNADIAKAITTRAGDRMDDNFIIDNKVATDDTNFVFSSKNKSFADSYKHPAKIIDDTQGFDGVRTYDDYAPTLRAGRSGLKVTDLMNYRIRKLTPTECWRLMGFTDEDINKCIAGGLSNAQLYKQAGNSIVVQVLEKLLKALFDQTENRDLQKFINEFLY